MTTPRADVVITSYATLVVSAGTANADQLANTTILTDVAENGNFPMPYIDEIDRQAYGGRLRKAVGRVCMTPEVSWDMSAYYGALDSNDLTVIFTEEVRTQTTPSELVRRVENTARGIVRVTTAPHNFGDTGVPATTYTIRNPDVRKVQEVVSGTNPEPAWDVDKLTRVCKRHGVELWPEAFPTN